MFAFLDKTPAMPTLELRATHKLVVTYYDKPARFDQFGIKHEDAVRSAFCSLSDANEIPRSRERETLNNIFGWRGPFTPKFIWLSSNP
jgi:hypothetical protein